MENKVEDYNIYIVACTNGLSTLYKSNEFAYSNDDLNGLDEDERIDSAQFAPSSTYFSCEITNNLRIYSLINSKSLDNFGRSGFHAVRLILRNKQETLPNFREVLERIEERFLKNKTTQTLAQQNYDDILSELKNDNSLSSKNIINFKSKTKYYFPYTTGEESKIDKLFNSKATYVASKIYAFDHNKVKSDDVAKQLGFRLFEPNISEEFTINFDRGYLNKISLGEKEVTVSGDSPLILIFPAGEKPKAYVGSKNVEKTIYGNVSFNKPAPPRPKPTPKYKTKGSPQGSVSSTLIIAIMGGLIVLVGAGLWYLEKWPFNEKVQDSADFEEQSQENEEADTLTLTPILESFVMIDSTSSKKKTEYYYTNSIDGLGEFRFTPDGNNLIYYENPEMIIKGNTATNTITQDGLNEFIKKHSIKGEQWNEFADSLKAKIGGEIPRYKKEVDVKPKPTVKNPEIPAKEKNPKTDNSGDVEVKPKPNVF